MRIKGNRIYSELFGRGTIVKDFYRIKMYLVKWDKNPPKICGDNPMLVLYGKYPKKSGKSEKK